MTPRVHHTRARVCITLVPLLLAGSQGAHALLERFAPASYEGDELFASGSAGRELLPLIASLGFGVLLAGLAAEAARPHRRGRGRAPLGLVALLPVVTFAIQEHLEYWSAQGRVPWALAAQWPFLAGIGLQLPVGFAAYVIVRALLRLARAVVSRLAPSPRRARPAVRLWARVAFEGPTVLLAASGRVTRGPPLRSAS